MGRFLITKLSQEVHDRRLSVGRIWRRISGISPTSAPRTAAYKMFIGEPTISSTFVPNSWKELGKIEVSDRRSIELGDIAVNLIREHGPIGEVVG